jgi:hypothetical protein
MLGGGCNTADLGASGLRWPVSLEGPDEIMIGALIEDPDEIMIGVSR